MRIDNPSISGSLSFIGGTNSISATSVSLTGSLTGTFEGAFSSTATANISGAFDSVSASLASDITANASSINSLNAATSSYLLNTTDTLTGNLTVTGTLTAQEFHTEFVSASIIYESGSTQFGNSADDTHVFTGNIGIGTNTPSAKLHVYSSGNGEIEVQRDSGALINLQAQASLGSIGTDSNHPLYLKTNAGTRLAINTAGSVGIGTTTPSATLQVVGRVKVTDNNLDFDKTNTAGGGDYNFIQIGYNGAWNQNANGLAAIEVNDGGGTVGKFGISYDGSSNGYFVVRDLYDSSGYAGSGDVFYVKGNGVAHFSGNVGIGETSPDTKLHVVQSGAGEQIVSILENSTNAGGTKSAIQLRNATNDVCSVKILGHRTGANFGSDLAFELSDDVDGSFQERMRITEVGRVGIGTSSPSTGLHVDTVGQQSMHAWFGKGFVNTDTYHYSFAKVGVSVSDNDGADPGAGIQFNTRNAADTNWFHGYMYQPQDGGLAFGTGGAGTTQATTKVIINTSGNVGIGTTTPDDKLHIKVASGDAGLQLNAATQTLRLDQNSIRTITNSSLAIFTNNTVTNGVYIQSDGNVGVGTNVPTSRLHVHGASAHIQFTGTNNRITFSGYRAVEGGHDGATLQLGEGYSKTVMYGSVGIGTTVPTHTLEVNGPTKSSYFTSNVNTTKSGLGPRDWTLIGPEDGSASRAAALQIGDVAGAKYAIAGGNYDLSFYKHVSSPDSYTRAFYISGVSAVDDSPNFVIDNKLYNNGKYYYSDGGLLLKKMVTCGDNTTTTLLTIDSNGSYSCIGGGELLIVFVDVGSPWGVYVWKGLLTMRTVQFGSMYSSGIQMIDARNNLDGTFTVSSSTSKTGGVADGKLIVTATTSSGISGTAHVSFNGWTTGGAQPY